MQFKTSVGIRHGVRLAPFLLVLTACPNAHADYPIVSHRYLADPGSMVYDGRVYLYNSNDDDNAVGGDYTMHSIVCVSSSDLKNWTDHGIVFSVPADATWANNSWAPQPITRDGTIFLYFGNSGNGIGVASSKDPTRGFKDAKGGYLINSSTPGATGAGWLFDPGALIDDDGQAYLSFGGNGETNARIIKLGSDLASVSGTAAQLAPKAFFEASFLFKRNSIYYFAYSTNSSAQTRIDYLTSSSPMSGYTYGGVIADGPPENGNNNHASEFEFKGKWYHAYHNRIVAKQAGIPDTYKRNIAIDALDFNADGSIKKVVYTTDGVVQIGNLNPYARVEAETTNAQSGIETEVCGEGGMDVTSINPGDWIRVRGLDFGTEGAESFTARVASAGSGGSIELRLGTLTGTLVGTCNVATTGGAQKWADATCAVSGATGVKDLYLKFTGSGSSELFNLNYWQFTPKGGSSVGAGGSSSSGGDGNAGSGWSGGGSNAAAGRSSVGGASATGGSPNPAVGGTSATLGTSGVSGAKATGGNANGSSGTSGPSGNGGSSNPRSTTASSGGNGSTSTSSVATGGVTTTTSTGALSSKGGSSATSTNQPIQGGSSSLSRGGSATGTNTASSSAAPESSTDSGGCNCRVLPKETASPSAFCVAVVGILALLRRRRRDLTDS